MLSNQKLQNSLDEIKEISRMDTALYNAKSKLVAATEGLLITPELEKMVAEFCVSMAERQVYREYHFYKVMV